MTTNNSSKELKFRALPHDHKTLLEYLSEQAHKNEYGLSEPDISVIASNIIEHCKHFPSSKSSNPKLLGSHEIAFHTQKFIIAGVYFENGTFSLGIREINTPFGQEIIIPSEMPPKDEEVITPKYESASSYEGSDQDITPIEKVSNADLLELGSLGVVHLPHEIPA